MNATLLGLIAQALPALLRELLPSCSPHTDEIAQLRAELAELRGQLAKRKPAAGGE